MDVPQIKVVFLGESKCGKTSIINRHLRGAKPSTHKPTIFENYSHVVEVDGKQVHMHICDTGGHSDYERLKKMSYLDANLFVLCIDYSRAKGLEEAEQTLPEIKATGCPVLLCLTKTDKGKKISKEAVQSFVNKHGIVAVHECSIHNKSSLKKLFEGIAKGGTHRRPDAAQNVCMKLFFCCY
ncbi:Ras-like protein gene family, member A [Enteropsectra breve]|nr:Ras-like protein gene family, member A [Enteropsectra breve]